MIIRWTFKDATGYIFKFPTNGIRGGIMNNRRIYSEGRYVLGTEDGHPYMTVCGRKYVLTCHPYEPCLYITDEYGNTTAVHNAFDPSAVLESFENEDTVTSITGTVYDKIDFCRMVEYAAGMLDIQIDEAEKVLREKANDKEPGQKKKKEESYIKEITPRPEAGKIIEDDPFYGVLAQYPDCVIDFCLVKNEHIEAGNNAHRDALLWASRKIFFDENDGAIWHFNVGRAEGKSIGADELFAPVDKNGKLNLRRAFLEPPYANSYTDADLEKLIAALFPGGTDGLEVFEWTTDWSEYFDEGHEWWGTLCLTVFDEKLDRFAVIMASATD